MSTYRPAWPTGDTETGELPTVTDDGAAPAAEPDAEEDWCYTTVEEWVAGWLHTVWQRDSQTGGRRWCVRWRDHPEAVLRLTLAWKTWERARHDPSAYTSWLLDTWDRMWAALTAPDGPFSACTPSRHDGSEGRKQPP